MRTPPESIGYAPARAGNTKVAIPAISPSVLDSVRAASERTGVSFSFLLAAAGRESAFRSHARNDASSAAGLFQFTRSTWLQLVKDYGARYGQGDLAKTIHHGSDGSLKVADGESERRILALRQDPGLSAFLAAEDAKANQARLEGALHRPPSDTDLYLAHFFGANGALRFLKADQAHPGEAAAKVVPSAAHSNPRLFYDRGSHHARGVSAVYASIQRVFEQSMQVADALQPKAVTSMEAADMPLPEIEEADVPTAVAYGSAVDGAVDGAVSLPMPGAADPPQKSLLTTMRSMLGLS